MITVGLDFGTHQTKVCIENKIGTETHYKFHRFKDLDGVMRYTLPSIICITPDNKLKYGYIDAKEPGSFKRYFKQAVFRNTDSPNMKLWEAARYSIWYLAYILFDLEKEYGLFTIQMGAPTDSSHIDDRKAIAVTILASAYNLVEKVFRNDKDAFLNMKFNELVECTEIIRYSDKVKKVCGVLVFPESYACLMPLIGRGKIAHGMNLIIDIGGGTTDISFFTIEETVKKSKIYHPQLYEFYSINKGLNYLTCQDDASEALLYKDVHIFKDVEINKDRSKLYFKEIDNICINLKDRLKAEWAIQTIHHKQKLLDKLKNRPVIYTGGGSTLGMLRKAYEGFQEIHLISYDSWKSKQFDDESLFSILSLCPILSTAYGLSISVVSDNIEKLPLREIFRNRRGDERDEDNGFDYGVDWDAWK